MSVPPPLHLFEGFGVELEYMIVDRDALDVRPVADELLRAASRAGAEAASAASFRKREPGGAEGEEYPSEVDMGPLCWSNELVLHVIELKVNGPASSLAPLPAAFQRDVGRINSLLAPMGGYLMPSAAHPWMNPDRDTRLWPHDYGEVYRAFNRVFGCRGHGWSNLQSVHINLPFADDAEFARLHAAVRLVLPIIPALAASSPVIEGRLTGDLDSRLAFYRTNCRRIPSVTGSVIPEPLFTRRDYEEQILGRIYRDIAPHDPDRTLQDEWVNARGAIARFARSTIEIRVIDMQECPAADLAISAAIVAVVKALAAEQSSDLARQQAWAVEPLDSILRATTREAESAVISDRGYLDVFGFPTHKRCTAGELWRYLIETLMPAGEPTFLLRDADAGCDSIARQGRAGRESALSTILTEGTLARRIINALGSDTSAKHVAAVYRELCMCLAEGRMFA